MIKGSSNFWDNLRGALRARARGDGTGPAAIRQAADEIKNERMARAMGRTASEGAAAEARRIEHQNRLLGDKALKHEDALAIARRLHKIHQKHHGRKLVQYEDAGVKVKVSGGYDTVRDVYTTDFIIADPGLDNQHWHIVLDEYGNEIMHEPRNDKPKGSL